MTDLPGGSGLINELRLTFKCSSQLANCLHVAGASLLHTAGSRPLNNELAMLSSTWSMPISPAMAWEREGVREHAIKLKGTHTLHLSVCVGCLLCVGVTDFMPRQWLTSFAFANFILATKCSQNQGSHSNWRPRTFLGHRPTWQMDKHKMQNKAEGFM